MYKILWKANKIVHLQTLYDPIYGPTPEIIREASELSLEGVDAELQFFDAGHLCIIPVSCLFISNIFQFEVKK